MSARTDGRRTGTLLALAVIGLVGWTTAAHAESLVPANVRPVVVLGQLDIDQDGFADAAEDSDGDGLPDNLERGGVEPIAGLDRQVSFPSPAAVRSSVGATFLLSRAPVGTDADEFDSDRDGLSDFVEVFGLKFIDDNGSSRLDFEPNVDFDDANNNGRWDPGEAILATAEWLDLNMDGMPSIGEWPLANLFATVDGDVKDGSGNPYVYVLDDCNGDFVPETVRVWWNLPANQQPDAAFANCANPSTTLGQEAVDAGVVDDNGDGVPDGVVVDGVRHELVRRQHDFDGFVFTDPGDPDTDGDGIKDGVDRDPLVNANLIAPAFGSGFERALAPSPDDEDLDNDGLGDGSDFGNDLSQIVDFPSDIAARLDAASPPDRRSGCATPTIPESLIEDVLAADWNGDGLWRLTEDASNYREGIPVAAAGQDNCVQTLYGSEHNTLFVVGARRLYGENPLLAAADGCRTPDDLPAQACGLTAYGQRGMGMGWQEKLLQAARTKTGPYFPDPRLWAILYAWRMPGFDIDGNGRLGVFENTFSTDDAHGYFIPLEPLCGRCGGGPISLFAGCLGFMVLKLVRPGRRS
ncbi:MAG: hypothetical protein HY718_00320 [Planctomycetes bacterium]|nr:hypothetical protein [Planctomycetota bacterium]